LLWLLVHRLALKLPTILQIEGPPILFHEGGVSELTDPGSLPSYVGLSFLEKPHSRIWALVDTRPSLPRPAPVIFDDPPFFVVHAASPGSNRDWHLKIDGLSFYMEPWSFSEVLLAYVDTTSGGWRRSHPL